jgi:DNA polymerase III subunit epsilon
VSEPWHLGMMLAFDLETTGVDVENDRIVTACTALIDGSGKTPMQVREWLAWPGVDIPEAAVKVHGVTTEHAREHGLPAAQVTGEVVEAVLAAAGMGIPVVAYNAAYDLTLLDRECGRWEAGQLIWDLAAAKVLVIDPLVLDKALDRYRKGSRQLPAAAQHYGVTAGKAHSAAGDAVTAARVAWKIAVTHPHIARMGASQLMTFQRAAQAEQARSLRAHLEREGKDASGVIEAWPWRAQTAGAAV